MSAGEMDRCECQEGHTGPLMMLVAVQCSGECGELYSRVPCGCCGRSHVAPFVAHAESFRARYQHSTCDSQVLLALEPLAAFVGAGT